jgi:hypothetical protein
VVYVWVRQVDGPKPAFACVSPTARRADRAEYTHEHEFAKTRTVVKLSAIGVEFVSRSEAKRLLHGLERFREVVLDFGGVQMVGQGFADEVFRVWPRDHPDVRLLPVSMNDAVAFMVERARRGAIIGR